MEHNTMRILSKCLFPVMYLALLSIPALADDHGRPHGRNNAHDRNTRWHGDVRRFHEHDLARWRGGHWTHGRHDGRSGWWWVVGTIWYFYPEPVYPYPDPYQPPLTVLPPPAPPAAPPRYWYYCPNPPGYYPYVPQCLTNWQRVPATPP
ncbi:MAG TPA: hypothetical protein VJ603_09510 [Paucimonas sp.]|nr:hypothetical protein [Paucimonas sp.]HJW57186.1 hypothetical protein [Burkholderiaceae bacterium]